MVQLWMTLRLLGDYAKVCEKDFGLDLVIRWFLAKSDAMGVCGQPNRMPMRTKNSRSSDVKGNTEQNKRTNARSLEKILAIAGLKKWFEAVEHFHKP